MPRPTERLSKPSRRIAWSYKCQHVILFLCISGMTLVVVTLFLNIYDKNPEGRGWLLVLQYIFLTIYLIIAFIGFVISFLAVFWEDSRDLKHGMRLLIIALVLYILFSLLSLVPNDICRKLVCPGDRCSDHHWLLGGRWRHLYDPIHPAMFSDQGSPSEESLYYGLENLGAEDSLMESTKNRSIVNFGNIEDNPVMKWMLIDAHAGSAVQLNSMDIPNLIPVYIDPRWLKHPLIVDGQSNETNATNATNKEVEEQTKPTEKDRTEGYRRHNVTERNERWWEDYKDAVEKKKLNEQKKKDTLFVALSIIHIIFIIAYYIITLLVLRKYKRYLKK